MISLLRKIRKSTMKVQLMKRKAVIMMLFLELKQEMGK